MGRSPTLGLLVSDITNPFYPQLAKSVEQEARRRGYAVVMCNTGDDPDDTVHYAEMLRDLGAASLIQASGGRSDALLIDTVGSWRRVVFINRRPKLDRCHFVVSDNEMGAVALTQHLLIQGHRRIGFIAGPEYASNAHERLNGFTRAMDDLGDAGQRTVISGDFTAESGRAGVRQWLAGGELPTAMIGVNDQVAVGILEALASSGLTVPDQVAVAGFDDIDLAGSTLLGLTSVRQHIERMGQEAVAIALSGSDSHAAPDPVHVVLQTELAIRRSTLRER
jgi:LacI family transcriptional regulator